MLIISFIISIIIPFIIYAFRKFYDKPNHKFHIKHFVSDDINKCVHPSGRGEHYMEHELTNKE